MNITTSTNRWSVTGGRSYVGGGGGVWEGRKCGYIILEINIVQT